jgi:acetoin utilization protein AcuB
MLVRELMTTALVTVPPETGVLEARRLMQRERIRHLLVTSGDGALQGIVTDRDIRLNVASPATSLSVWELNYLLARLTVGQVMSRSPVTTRADADAADAARVMLERKIGALPVVHGGLLMGIVTESDFVRAVAMTSLATASA